MNIAVSLVVVLIVLIFRIGFRPVPPVGDEDGMPFRQFLHERGSLLGSGICVGVPILRRGGCRPGSLRSLPGPPGALIPGPRPGNSAEEKI